METRNIWVDQVNNGRQAVDLNRPEWQERANCRDNHPQDFHPGAYDQQNFSKQNLAAIAAAKLICDGCIVSDDCLQFAQDNNIRDGIWGGLIPRERGHGASSPIKEAVKLYASGKTMAEASLGVGMSKSWLGVWKSQNPEEFEALLAEADRLN